MIIDGGGKASVFSWNLLFATFNRQVINVTKVAPGRGLTAGLVIEDAECKSGWFNLYITILVSGTSIDVNNEANHLLIGECDHSFVEVGIAFAYECVACYDIGRKIKEGWVSRWMQYYYVLIVRTYLYVTLHNGNSRRLVVHLGDHLDWETPGSGIA